MTDACINGIAAVISQGDDWKRSAVAAFFSAKLNCYNFFFDYLETPELSSYKHDSSSLTLDSSSHFFLTHPVSH